MGSALDLTESQTDLIAKAAGYRVPAESVDGMDVLAVEGAVKRAIDEIRAGRGPRFIEFRTYRFRAHSMFDAQLYRDKQEIEEWRQRGPIVTFERRLRELEMLDDAELARIESEVAQEIETAVEFAEASEWEPIEELTRHVYAEGGPA
jgi:TPP-dependent pyruvate/acetoin dehydrogenase alpha subunit